jgi:hypothetical protein
MLLAMQFGISKMSFVKVVNPVLLFSNSRQIGRPPTSLWDTRTRGAKERERLIVIEKERTPRSFLRIYIVEFFTMGKKRTRTRAQDRRDVPGKKTKKKDRSSCSSSNMMMEDWIATLAKQETTEMTCSKASRIEKRAAKKRQREERKQKKLLVAERERWRKEDLLKMTFIDSKRKEATKEMRRRLNPDQTKPASAKEPKEMESPLQFLAERLKMRSQEKVSGKKSDVRPYSPEKSQKKAVVKKKMLDSSKLQPRACDYGGLGLARPSLYIQLDDPAWKAVLEEEFQEHVPGFFGKQRSKVMKKQLDGNMLWRQMLQDKQQSKGKKKTIPADERVESMIKAGKI